MFLKKKVQTVGSISDFLTESPVKLTGQVVTAGALAGMATAVLTKTEPVFAYDITTKIIHAFDPLTQLIQGLSYPVGFIMITAGCLVIMTGKKQQGLNMIKWAAIGYILMQFAPAIMAILVEVGKAMATR